MQNKAAWLKNTVRETNIWHCEKYRIWVDK